MPGDVRDVVGRGLAFPFDVSATGRVRWSVPLETVTDTARDSATVNILRHLILTIAGQRVLRREYGTGIVAEMFQLAQPALVSTILFEAVRAVNRWERRIEIVDYSVDLSGGTVVVFQFAWRLRRSGRIGVAVVPISLDFKAAEVG